MKIVLGRSQIIVCLVMSLMLGIDAASFAAPVSKAANPVAHHASHHPALITHKVAFKNNRLDFSAKLPQLVGDDPSVQSANWEIRQVVYTSLADFRKESVEDGHYSVELSYTTPVRTNHMLGLVFEEFSYLQGSAHPMTTHHTVNLDLTTGKHLILSELFTPGTAYLDTLATASRPLVLKQLKERDADEGDLFEEGLKPMPQNFQNWLITPNGLRLIFDPYQVAAYAIGPVTITIPWNSLPHLRKDFINTLLQGSTLN